MISDHYFSIVVPTFNDGDSGLSTVTEINEVLTKNNLYGNMIIVDDSKDGSEIGLQDIANNEERITYVRGDSNGFGGAIRKGFSRAQGDTVIVMMGDGSEDPNDIIPIIKNRIEGYEVVFGNRFGSGNRRKDYPKMKYIANRMMNIVLAIIFRIKSKDITNAFTGYDLNKLRILNLKSNDFELSIEIPIKMIKKLKCSYTSVDVAWKNRIEGESKMR